MRIECTQVLDDLADLVAGDPDAIDRHADHLAGCDDCRDARHEATELAELVAHAGADHVPPSPEDLVARLLAAVDREPPIVVEPVASAAPVEPLDERSTITSRGHVAAHVTTAPMRAVTDPGTAARDLVATAPATMTPTPTATSPMPTGTDAASTARDVATSGTTLVGTPATTAASAAVAAARATASSTASTAAMPSTAATPSTAAMPSTPTAPTASASTASASTASASTASPTASPTATPLPATAPTPSASTPSASTASAMPTADAADIGGLAKAPASTVAVASDVPATAVVPIAAANGKQRAKRTSDQHAAPAATSAGTAPTFDATASSSTEAAQRDDVALAVRRKRARRWILATGAVAAVAAGGVGVYSFTRPAANDGAAVVASGDAATVKSIDRAAADGVAGLEVRTAGDDAWRPLRANDAIPAGAAIRSDERTRAAVELADGTRLVLDYRTQLSFDAAEPRRAKLASGRIVADVVHVDGRPAAIETAAGRVDVTGTRFAVTASDDRTTVQVVRGSVNLVTAGGATDEVRAGEEGVIDHGALAVDAAPGLAREVEWSELADAQKTKKGETAGAGLGALRAYKPGEARDRDWNLALAKHDVKVRVSGPIARTEITETFRNEAAETLEGVYQFPLPPDAQIDGLALDVDGGFVEGAFVDKERAQKIWRGVIDKAAPRKQEMASSEIIWVEGRWRDPALLDWKRGGRFELRVYPIPAKGQRTIKIAYTQVVTPRGPWRQYVYPLPVSADGSTVADEMTVDVEVRGAVAGQVRAAGYDLVADPARKDVNALSLAQHGFVPRGDLVVDYRATDGDAELRAWTYAGATAAAPDDKLAAKKNVGIDPKVVDAQRAVAADARPTAVLAVKPKLPRWRAAVSRDYMIVVDASQSMFGERYTRASELATRLVEQMDRRDRFSVMACDSECRVLGDLRAPAVRAGQEVATWLAAAPPAGASDIVAAVRAASTALPATADRERWVIYIGDGFATTGFRRAGDVEKAIGSWVGSNTRVSTIGIGTDADAATLGAAARGGGGSYLAWVPGQSVKTAAIAGLESTYGTALRDATIELPAGLADVAPTVLPTVRAGEEVLVAARVTGDVAGSVTLRGTVGGQKYEQKFPLKLAVSTAKGNAFVPRLWASLAIDQLERRAGGDDRPRLVALSQAYGVMSKETSLLVLESQAMFDAFGVDRSRPSAPAWTGEESLDEVVASGTIDHTSPKDVPAKMPAAAKPAQAKADRMSGMRIDQEMLNNPLATEKPRTMGHGRGGFGDRFAMRRTWVRVPSISAYDKVWPSITKAVGDAERALVKAPDSRERHRNLVQALSYAGDLARAHEIATKWLARDQLDPQALGYQADLLGRDGKRDLALRTLAGVVDLDADRPAAHERMIAAYENANRLAQACSHRIALAAVAAKADATKAAAGAVRCLRSLGRAADADIVLRGLPDEARLDAAKLAAETAAAPKLAGDLVVDASWDGGEDLDISLVTPDGTRVSWMGGRSDLVIGDATSTTQEHLALKSLKRGHYLVEVGRASAAKAAKGKLDVTALGTKKSLPFELAAGASRAIVGRISIDLQEKLETIEPGSLAPHLTFGAISDEAVRRVVLARSPSLQSCYAAELNENPGAAGRLVLTIAVRDDGSTQTSAAGPLALTARCVEQQLASMHVTGGARTLRFSLGFSTGG